MPTGLYTRRSYDYESQKFMPRQNKTSFFEKTVLSYKLDWNVRLKAMLQMVDKRRLIALVLMEFLTIVTRFLKQWVVFSTTVHVKKLARQ